MKILHSMKLWWRAARPYSFPASIVPGALGTAAAWADGYRINPLYALLAISGVLAAHTGANLINDYEDFRRGVDRPGVLGGSGMLVEGILSPRSIFAASLVFFAIALLAGLPLIMKIGLPLLALAIAGFIAGAGYGLPPLSLKYRAMGEPTVFLAFGSGITLGTYMVQSRVFSWAPIAYSLPIGMMVVAILFANNIRDVEDDGAAGITTLPGYLSKAFSSWIFAFLVIGPYLLLLVFCAAGLLQPGALLALLTIPFAVRLLLKSIRPEGGYRRAMSYAVPHVAQLSLIFGAAMIAGMIAYRMI